MLVSIGFTEGTRTSVGCLWNSNVLISAEGTLLNHHRKLVPTYYEKLIWASGDGSGLRVSDTELGRIGMLICGENTNPLARFALMAEGEQVHISSGFDSASLLRRSLRNFLPVGDLIMIHQHTSQSVNRDNGSLQTFPKRSVTTAGSTRIRR